MKTFKKWNGKAIEDTGAYMSKEAISFCTAFKNMLKHEGKKYGFEPVNVTKGHYFVSGFAKSADGICIYISFNIPRGNMPVCFSHSDCRNGCLVRYAKSEKDYKDESNNFCALEELPETLDKMFTRRRSKLSA